MKEKSKSNILKSEDTQPRDKSGSCFFSIPTFLVWLILLENWPKKDTVSFTQIIVLVTRTDWLFYEADIYSICRM